MTGDRATGPRETPDVARLVEQLGDADVRWDGSYAGLLPAVAGDAGRQLLDAGDGAIPPLIDALDDESRFVAAHVLLTLLSGVEHATAPWNGLDVELTADGEARIDPRQRFELARRWRAWQAQTPHPGALPLADGGQA